MQIISKIKEFTEPYKIWAFVLAIGLAIYLIANFIGTATGLGIIGGLLILVAIVFCLSFLYGWFVLAKPNKPKTSVYSLPKAEEKKVD